VSIFFRYAEIYKPEDIEVLTAIDHCCFYMCVVISSNAF